MNDTQTIMKPAANHDPTPATPRPSMRGRPLKGFAGLPYNSPNPPVTGAHHEASPTSTGAGGIRFGDTKIGSTRVKVDLVHATSPISPPSTTFTPPPPHSSSTSIGWGSDGLQTPDAVQPPEAVLAVERHSIESVKEKLAFDPDHVPKPSDYELEKPFGGRKHFMMAHGLRYYDKEDCHVRRQILDQLKDLEWQNRVNTAREEYARTGKLPELPTGADGSHQIEDAAVPV